MPISGVAAAGTGARTGAGTGTGSTSTPPRGCSRQTSRGSFSLSASLPPWAPFLVLHDPRARDRSRRGNPPKKGAGAAGCSCTVAPVRGPSRREKTLNSGRDRRPRGGARPRPGAGGGSAWRRRRRAGGRGRGRDRQDDAARCRAAGGDRVHLPVGARGGVGGALGHGPCWSFEPGRDLLAELPAHQAEALAAALGWGPAEPRGPVPVAAATLSLLAAAAEQAPLLVLVDDLQWVDRESAAALLFAARRLRPDAVAFLFAVRSGSSRRTAGGVADAHAGRAAGDEAAGILPESLAERSWTGWSRAPAATRWPCWR